MISLPEIFFVTTRNAVDKARNDTVNESVYLSPGSAEGLGVLSKMPVHQCMYYEKQTGGTQNFSLFSDL